MTSFQRQNLHTIIAQQKANTIRGREKNKKGLAKSSSCETLTKTRTERIHSNKMV